MKKRDTQTFSTTTGSGYLAISCFLLFIAVVLLLADFSRFIHSPASPRGEALIVSIPSGLSLRGVARLLEEKGIVSNDFRFMVLARWRGAARSLKAGEYEFSPAMTPDTVLSELVSGRERLVSVTIPEGFTMVEIARILEQKEITGADDFLQLARNREKSAIPGVNNESLEGYLFPDTYHLRRLMKPEDVAAILVKRWREVFSSLGGETAGEDMTINEIMTLASIIEKETSSAQERPLVASVFLNRLKKGMPLGADPTVIYGIDHFDGNLTRMDLRTDTPYNTYVRKGLPPGPIANPGRESIAAALNPAHTDYLYFVSKNDGTHLFSTNYEAHTRAVRKYQKPK